MLRVEVSAGRACRGWRETHSISLRSRADLEMSFALELIMRKRILPATRVREPGHLCTLLLW